jgi:hypothetical protein
LRSVKAPRVAASTGRRPPRVVGLLFSDGTVRKGDARAVQRFLAAQQLREHLGKLSKAPVNWEAQARLAEERQRRRLERRKQLRAPRRARELTLERLQAFYRQHCDARERDGLKGASGFWKAASRRFDVSARTLSKRFKGKLQ